MSAEEIKNILEVEISTRTETMKTIGREKPLLEDPNEKSLC